MIAPIDAVATVDVSDEKITLRLNMRTLALAKENGVNLLQAGSLDSLDPLELAVLVYAFAAPEQPDFTEEQAFALLVRHADAVKPALVSLSRQFVEAAGVTGGDGARPTTPAQRKRRIS